MSILDKIKKKWNIMDTNPCQYAGRGATTSDLNEQQLEQIYQNIEAEFGEEEAGAFVRMVADIPKLTATDFLNALEKLEQSQWQWDENSRLPDTGIEGIANFPGGEEERDALVFGIIGSTFTGHAQTDQTPLIRDNFLLRHHPDFAEPDKNDPDQIDYDELWQRL